MNKKIKEKIDWIFEDLYIGEMTSYEEKKEKMMIENVLDSELDFEKTKKNFDECKVCYRRFNGDIPLSVVENCYNSVPFCPRERGYRKIGD